MSISRAFLGTALGLTLAGCAMDAAPAASLGITPVETTATANRAAAASIQVASLATPQVMSDATPPVIQKGTVLWRRSGDEADLPPTPRMAEEINRLKSTIAEMRGDTSQQMNALEDRLAGNQLVQAQTLAALKEDQARQEKELRAQTADAVTAVASLAKQSVMSTEGMARQTAQQWTATTQSIAQLENRLQGTTADVREARQVASAAEANAKTYTAEQLAAQKDVQAAQFTALSNQLTTQLASTQQATTAQLEALKSTTSTQLQATREVQGAQLAALSSQVVSNQQLTALQIAELQKITADNRALARSETSNVAAALRQYADAQMQQVVATTSATLVNLAQATDQSVARLSDQTNRRLGLMWQAANANAEKLAEQKANIVATSLLALQKQTEDQRLTPDQIRHISEETVANSTPEFRALALQTLKESNDYIRTVARTAVQDKDPAMQTALADAARDVITKDNRVVFAIRKAVADEIQGAVTGDVASVSATTRLGEDRTADGAEQLDPNRLRIAQLLAPGSNKVAPDAALSDSQLAAISPAAGQAPAGLGGQQSWSTPGTSLMRSRNRADWMDIRQYKVVVHEDDQTLQQLLAGVLKHAEPFTGPWQIRWKVSEENKELMDEKFSMDAETNFQDFVSYLAQYVVNDRGVKLTFSLFDSERIIVISD